MKILKTVEYNVFGFLIILVPFVSHLYIWGMFCEWKGIKALSIALKFFAIAYGSVILIMTILYLCGAEITVR